MYAASTPSAATAASSVPSGGWPGAAAGASLAAIAGGAALIGRWPLFAVVLLLQLALTLAWLALMDVPAASGGVIIMVSVALTTDLYAVRVVAPDQAPLAGTIAAAFAVAVVRQLARRRRGHVTESLADVMTGVLMVAFASHLLATRTVTGGVGATASICFAVAAATVVRQGIDALIARPALRAGAERGWPGLILSVAAGAAAGAYVGASRAGLTGRTGALIGVGSVLAAAVVDLGIGMGSLHLGEGRARSAVVPLGALLPLVVAAPVGYGVARLLAAN